MIKFLFILLVPPIFGSKLTFIDSSSSLTKLKPISWRENVFNFKVQTNGKNGNILTIINSRKNKMQLYTSFGKLRLHRENVKQNNEIDKWNWETLNQISFMINATLQKTEKRNLSNPPLNIEQQRSMSLHQSLCNYDSG